jgi:hypothetical protein
MPKLDIEDIPQPFDLSDEEIPTFMDEMAVVANTADFLHTIGAPIEADADTIQQEKALLQRAVTARDRNALSSSVGVGLGAKSFLTTYGSMLAFDVGQARAAVTAKLMEIANCGDIRYELKALELLGKHSDIGLFTERSEITVKHQDANTLEAAIKARIKSLIDTPSLPATQDELDDELGVFTPPEPDLPDLDELLGTAPPPDIDVLNALEERYAEAEKPKPKRKRKSRP